MIPDIALAKLCAASYDPDATWDQEWNAEGIDVQVIKVGSIHVICFRGSVTEQDWTRDFSTWLKKDPDIGYCHAGFLSGMHVVVANLMSSIGVEPYAVTGHSLGAARALIFSGLMTAIAHIRPTQVTTFGTPRPGFAKLSEILNGGGYPIHLYKNRSDPVTDVPWWMGLFKHPVEQIKLDVDPGTGPRPFSDHKIACYVKGVGIEQANQLKENHGTDND